MNEKARKDLKDKIAGIVCKNCATSLEVGLKIAEEILATASPIDDRQVPFSKPTLSKNCPNVKHKKE
jgi:hypothetical protein